MLEKLIDLDTRLFLFLNGFHSPFWDKVMVFLSGKIEWVPLYIGLIIFLIFRLRKNAIWAILGVIVTITLADQIAVIGFKEVFQRLRPSHNPELANQIHLVNNYTGGLYGFVSNHAANSFALATFISLVSKRTGLTIGMFYWASIVSYSRIYLGVHYPGDIIGGALLGICIAYLVYWGYTLIIRRKASKEPTVR